jgi:hypothetical protein
VRGAPQVSAAAAADCLGDLDGVEELLRARGRAMPGYRTAWDRDTLLWRYDSLAADYRAVAEREDGRLAGLAIFRLSRRGRLWELRVCELMVRPGDGRTARRLIGAMTRATRSDYVVALPVPGCGRAHLVRAGFVRSPVGVAPLGVVAYGEHEPDPSRPSSWSLSLGDLERLPLF